MAKYACLSRVQLPGLAEDFSESHQIRWPNFLASDILGYYVFPERRRVYRSKLCTFHSTDLMAFD